MLDRKYIFFVLSVFFVFNFFVYSEESYYEVVKGDCLWNISKRFYKNPFLWIKIYEINKQIIKNPDLIYPGQKFVIPGLETTQNLISEQIVQDNIENSTEFETTKEFQKEPIEEKFLIKDESYTIKDLSLHLPYNYPKNIKIKDFAPLGKIIKGEELKFVYIDFDKVYCELKTDEVVKKGMILGIYHLGPSKYDINLMKISKDELTLVGYLKIEKILENKIVFCNIVKVYSPVVIGDYIALFK
ncbi:MAG: LysM peptidoglycan-binding domain-containing protein [Endomicrobia bacterium]|nr:LysM peptidoglycan-binding domain-containing protein [Endomicrobiia bacterium]